MDNAVSGDVSGGRIILHGGRWEVRPKNGAASQPKPPPAESVKEMPGQEGAGVLRVAAISRSGGTVLMRPPKYLLPDGTYAIPTMQDSSIEKVLVLPPTHDTSQAGPVWRPQICKVVKGAAMYINRSPIQGQPGTPGGEEGDVQGRRRSGSHHRSGRSRSNQRSRRKRGGYESRRREGCESGNWCAPP